MLENRYRRKGRRFELSKERKKKEEGFSYLGEKEEAIKVKMSAINNVLIDLAVAENLKFTAKIDLRKATEFLPKCWVEPLDMYDSQRISGSRSGAGCHNKIQN